MTYRFDHVVHAVHRPEDAALQMRQAGIHTVNGGRHSSGGTYNALAYFGLSYIEWLGIYDTMAAKTPTPNALPRQVAATLQSGPGLMRIALRTNDLQETAQHLTAAGISFTGPVRLGRIRPDGKEIAWTLLFPEGTYNQLLYPFFIQWDESDEQRRADLEANGSIAAHDFGQLRLAEVGFAVRDLDETIAAWSNLLRQEPRPAVRDQSFDLYKCSFQLPNVSLSFYAAGSNDRITDLLRQRGEHPFYVRFVGDVPEARDVHVAGGWYRIEPET